MAEILHEIADQLYNGEIESIADLVQKALDQGIAPGEVLSDGLLVGMERVGKDFKSGELFVPEVIVAAKAMHTGMDTLRPLLGETNSSSVGTFVIGTVKGDLHDIGKSLVKLLLEGAGFAGVDLGIDVTPEAFVEAIRTHKPDLLAMSALLTTTMVSMKATLEALEQAGLRDTVKVMVGGAPVTSAYSADIGADGYAPDAARAVDIATSLVNGK
jgi:5-methyltetrahydrofolate--homocysteine methyltransferase